MRGGGEVLVGGLSKGKKLGKVYNVMRVSNQRVGYGGREWGSRRIWGRAVGFCDGLRDWEWRVGLRIP